MELLPSFATWLSGQSWLQDFMCIVTAAWFLDRQAGPGVKEAFGLLLNPRENTHINANAAAAIRALFNLVYELLLLNLLIYVRRRLFSAGGRTHSHPGDLRTLRKWIAVLSATFIAAFLTLYLTYPIFTGLSTAENTAFWSGFVSNVVSHGVAVLVIRRWLLEGGATPWKLLGGSAAGILLVISFTGLRLVFFLLTTNLFFSSCAPFSAVAGVCHAVSVDRLPVSYVMTWDEAMVQQMLPILSQLHLRGVLVGCAIHLWLPAVAILAIVLHTLNWVLRVLGVFRWGVDSWMGSSHPVLALGVFAGVVAVSVQWLQEPPPWLQQLLQWLTSL